MAAGIFALFCRGVRQDADNTTLDGVASLFHAPEGVETHFCFVAEIAFPPAEDGPHTIEARLVDNHGRELRASRITTHAETQPGDPYFRYTVFVRFPFTAAGTTQIHGEVLVDNQLTARGMMTAVGQPPSVAGRSL